MSTREFLTKYKFKSTEIEYIIEDFERGSSHNPYNTTKKLLVNKKHIIKAKSTKKARIFVDDLTTRGQLIPQLLAYEVEVHANYFDPIVFYCSHQVEYKEHFY